MRRPLCLFALLFAVCVWAALMFLPPEPFAGQKADGRYVTLRGVVEAKEYAMQGPEQEKILKMTLKNAVLETSLPKEAALATERGDKVLCQINDNPDMQNEWAHEGSAVRIRGKIRLFKHPSNDGEFDAYLYYHEIEGYLFSLTDAHILSYDNEKDPVRAPLSDLRCYLSETLDRVFSDQYGNYGLRCASVLKAMLLGQNDMVEKETRERFQAAGIIHVLCVSGLHISMIGSGLHALLRKCGMPAGPACAVTVVFLYLYGLLTGMHASCFRALIMFGMRAASRALGRTYDMRTAMAAAAVLLLIDQPMYLFHSGFLFSFAAVAAAALLIPVVPGLLKPLAIPIFTLPVQLCFFYTFPLYSVLCNVIVILLAPAVMISGGISLFLGAIAGMVPAGIWLGEVSEAGARAVGQLPILILFIFDKLCTLTERLPFSTLTPGKPPGWVIALYCLMVGSVIFDRNRCTDPGRRRRLLQLLCTAAAVILLFGIRSEPPFALYMWDVGQGDGLCIRTKGEKGDCTILIDGGSSTKKSVGNNIEAPFLRFHGISRIDYCILTHDDLDHCSGLLELLEQSDRPGGIRIGNLGLPSVQQRCKGGNYLKIEEICAKKGIPVTYLHRGMSFTQGELLLQCLHPGANASYENANEYSAVLLLRYGNFSAMLTGDLEEQGERDLLNYLGDSAICADILKAAHHGSAGGTTQAFLDRVRAEAALISCGKGNERTTKMIQA